MKRQRWVIKPHDSALVQSVQSTSGLPAVVAQILAARGMTHPDDIRRFVECRFNDLRAPDLLPGISKAVDVIHSALSSNKKIVVYGDYDADGMTATAILCRCLKLLGSQPQYFVPNRLDDGYGLNNDALKTLADRGAELIITVDCGVASIESVSYAKSLGMDIVVTDHHQTAEQLPDADAIVHPALPGADYPFAGICGAGVAFKLAWALCQREAGSPKVSDEMRQFLLSAIGLAAIGTIADVVPLQDENRIIVKHGLAALKHSPIRGIDALMKLNSLDAKGELSAEDIGFTIGPRLNAAGRLGQAQLGVELLVSESAERIDALADYIHKLNESRDHLDRSILLAANKQIKEQFDADNDPAFVLAGRGWHAGVIGIVAGRLASKYNKPAVLISLDEMNAKPGVGSARSGGDLDLYKILDRCKEHLVGFGGHTAAAGLTINDDSVDAFREAFLEIVVEESANNDLEAKLAIDAEVQLTQLTMETMNQLEALAPFGQDHPRPVLCAIGVELAAPAKRIGGGGRHVSMKLQQQNKQLGAVAFGHGDWADQLTADGQRYDFAFQPSINEFKGRRSVQLQLIDWRNHLSDNSEMVSRESEPAAS